MAYVTQTAPATGGFQSFVARVQTALQKRAIYSQTVGELQQLNDRELADLGISRSQIKAVARSSVYGG